MNCSFNKLINPSRITDAYQQRAWEIDLERTADGVMTRLGATPSIYDESIKILNTAKRQLLGY
jgi:hypothetical protein